MKESRHISIQTIEERSTSFAIFKARSDVDRIVASCGYKSVVFGSLSPVGIVRVLKRHYDIFSLKFRLRSNDVVFFQFPWIHNNKREFYNNLFGSGAKVHCLIHDLDSLRSDNSDNGRMELEALSRCDSIIAHTPAMKRYLIEHGIDGKKIKLLYVFSYLTDDPIHEIGDLRNVMAIFAGNINKSPFVNHLGDVADRNLRFNIYGNGGENFVNSSYVTYKGCFSPTHPGVIEGNWGLVWDGGCLDTCDGPYGDYLRYNSSHKIALYMSLGIPVILWSESSLKGFVEKNKLGIAVNSIYDITRTIAAMDDDSLNAIAENVRRFAVSLRNGERMAELLSAIG